LLKSGPKTHALQTHLLALTRASRLLLPTHSFVKQIQGVPGGKVNILGGHIIGHSKKKTYMCPTPNGFRGRAISSYSCKIVDKEILRTILILELIFLVTMLVQFTYYHIYIF